MFASHHQLPLGRDLVLAYSCSHCEAIRASEVQLLAKDTAHVYTTSSGLCLNGDELNCAWTGTAHGYIKLSTDCAKPECKSLSLTEREEKLIAAVKTSRMSFQNMIQKYLSYGVRYHNLALALRVKTASQPDLALVHHTYSIESRAWRDDPFLQPFANLYDALQRFEERLKMGVWREEYMSVAVHHLNTFRATALEVKSDIEKLREGVRTLATLEGCGEAPIFRTIVSGRKHHGKRFGRIASTAVQKFVMEQALLTKWSLRIDEMEDLYMGKPLPLFATSIACPLID